MKYVLFSSVVFAAILFCTSWRADGAAKSFSEQERANYQQQFALNRAQIERQMEHVRAQKEAEIRAFEHITKSNVNTLNHNLLSDEFAHHLIQNAPAQVREIAADYQLSKTLENEADRSSLMHKAILFVGNPGNGKTNCARALGQSIGFVIVVQCPLLGNSFQYSVQSELKRIVDQALDTASISNQPVVIILDEIQAVMDTQKHKHDSYDVAFALGQLMSDYEDNPNIIFIATANDTTSLPDNIKSRFEQDSVIEFKNPGYAARIENFKCNIKDSVAEHMLDESMIQKMARETNGFSHRDCKGLITKIRVIAIRNNQNNKKITISDITNAIKAIKDNKAKNASSFFKRANEFCRENQPIIVCSAVLSGAVVGIVGGIIGTVKAATPLIIGANAGGTAASGSIAASAAGSAVIAGGAATSSATAGGTATSTLTAVGSTVAGSAGSILIIAAPPAMILAGAYYFTHKILQAGRKFDDTIHMNEQMQKK